MLVPFRGHHSNWTGPGRKVYVNYRYSYIYWFDSLIIELTFYHRNSSLLLELTIDLGSTIRSIHYRDSF